MMRHHDDICFVFDSNTPNTPTRQHSNTPTHWCWLSIYWPFWHYYIPALLHRRALFEIPIAEAQEYHGDCVIVAVRAALNICPSQARQFESTLIRTQRLISDVRRHLLSSGA